MSKRKTTFKSQAAKKLYDATMANFELDESHHQELLKLACQSLDVIDGAVKQIRKDGQYLQDRYGQTKPHPALKVAAENRVIFARLLRELNLDDESLDADVRPPRHRG